MTWWTRHSNDVREKISTNDGDNSEDKNAENKDTNDDEEEGNLICLNSFIEWD